MATREFPTRPIRDRFVAGMKLLSSIPLIRRVSRSRNPSISSNPR